MIDYHCFCQIKHLHAHQGLNAAQIARELTLDPRTVAYWLTQEHFRPRKSPPRSSKLDPFKPEIGRLLYVEFTVSQTMEHFLACHQHAFEFFGGIPHKVMVDNLKSAVLQRALGEVPVFNPK